MPMSNAPMDSAATRLRLNAKQMAPGRRPQEQERQEQDSRRKEKNEKAEATGVPRGEKTKTKTIEAEGKVDGANHKDEDADEEKDSAMQTEEEHLEEIRRAQKLRAKGELEKYKETIKLLRKDPTNKHLIDQRVYYEEKQKQRSVSLATVFVSVRGTSIFIILRLTAILIYMRKQ